MAFLLGVLKFGLDQGLTLFKSKVYHINLKKNDKIKLYLIFVHPYFNEDK